VREGGGGAIAVTAAHRRARRGARDRRRALVFHTTATGGLIKTGLQLAEPLREGA
jgi:hypothetical protein